MLDRMIRSILLAALLATAGCGSNETPTATHTIYGSLTSTSIDPSNRVGWIKLVTADGTLSDSALYSSSCLFQGPGCDYSMLFIPEGEYKAFAFIDLNGNADEPGLVPDSGDLVSYGKPLMLWSKTQADFPDSAWHMMP